MDKTTTQTPADVRELAGEIIRSLDLIARNYDSYEYGLPVMTHYDDMVDTVVALLRTPRGEREVEAKLWRKVGEEPPPNGVQVLAYDPRPDGYSYAGCWAYTLIRKGNEYYLDGERCDDEDQSRLQIEEWLWQPLPPYPGSRSNEDDVRDAVSRSDAQGDAEALAALIVHIWRRCKDEGPHYRETDEFWEDFERAYQLALLRTPRSEGEAREEPVYMTCMGCGQEFDPDDDTQSRYHEAACEVVDYEPARVEIARRLRGAALRSEAQGEDTIPVSALRSEIALLRKHKLLPYLAWARLCALAGGEPVGEDTPAALHSDA